MIAGRGLLWPRLYPLVSIGSRCIYSKTGQWPVTCTFDIQCAINFVKQVEKHWRPILAEIDAARSKSVLQERPELYVLSMFPYPSGSLHLGNADVHSSRITFALLGHVKIYTAADIITRYNRLQGKRVLQPMGWDSFGLPAENAAIANNLNPHDWTYSNIAEMRKQMETLGLSVDWREATSDPSFYKWTQWLFAQLFEKELVYKSMAKVNWDPIDCTVLADAQVCR